MRCKICHRKSVKEGYCLFHLKAYVNILDKFSAWKESSYVSRTEYLTEIQKNSLTGEWAKEVAKYLFEEEKKNESKH